MSDWNTNEMSMTEVVTCPRCGKHEFYGCMTWTDYYKDGRKHPVCRRCAYEKWESESKTGWKPRPGKDYVYPVYIDGLEHAYDKK